MGRKAGGLYINPKKFGVVGKPCMKDMRGKPKNPARTINHHLQRLGKYKFL